MNTKEVGNLTELQCITDLYALGCDISIPFGNSQKYDIIMDYNNTLYKVQIKHATENTEKGYIQIKTRWQSHNHTGYVQKPYTENEIDFFATYYNNQVYLIPITECTTQEKRLWIIPPKNNYTKGVHYLNEYEGQKILNNL